MSITTTKRTRVYARDDDRCAACGRPLRSIQHRRRKGMGGVKGAAALVADGFANLLTLCLGCNYRLEQDADFAALGNAKGWRLLEGEHATAVAVWFTWAQQWRQLRGDGTFVVVAGRNIEDWGDAA